MNNIILIGGGGHCISCIDVIEAENKYKIVGILDSKEKVGQKVSGYKIIGSDEMISELLSQTNYFLITIGQMTPYSKRDGIFSYLKEIGAKIATVVSPLAYVSHNAKIGVGTIVMHGAIINAGVSVGDNCIINSMALIEHEAFVENNCHISTGVVINGRGGWRQILLLVVIVPSFIMLRLKKEVLLRPTAYVKAIPKLSIFNFIHCVILQI